MAAKHADWLLSPTVVGWVPLAANTVRRLAGCLPLGVSRGWYVIQARGRRSYGLTGVCNCFFLWSVWVCECISVCVCRYRGLRNFPPEYSHTEGILRCVSEFIMNFSSILWLLFHFMGASLYPPFAPTPRTTNPTPDASFLSFLHFFSSRKTNNFGLNVFFSDRMCARYRNFLIF